MPIGPAVLIILAEYEIGVCYFFQPYELTAKRKQ